LHFSHIGLTDARTFTRSAIYCLFERMGGEAQETAGRPDTAREP
jgi:hypothetical protein